MMTTAHTGGANSRSRSRSRGDNDPQMAGLLGIVLKKH